MILFEKKINEQTFRLVQNSIIEEQVDAIVNPANESLAHGGGVAGLISRAGGPEIQRESNKKAPVPTGQATHTHAGTLPYKYIIHTVGPIYRGGFDNEPELLASAVKSALKEAVDLKLTSVSMPSISTGIFGYPLKPAVKIIYGAIITFLKSSAAGTLKDVHLCEFSQDKAIEIKRIIEEITTRD